MIGFLVPVGSVEFVVDILLLMEPVGSMVLAADVLLLVVPVGSMVSVVDILLLVVPVGSMVFAVDILVVVPAGIGVLDGSMFPVAAVAEADAEVEYGRTENTHIPFP